MAIVTVNNVSRIYHQGKTEFKALDDVSLTINKGEFTALAGPSGSGKTTLLNLIGGIDTADKGTILLDGQDLSSLKKGELADLRLQDIGFVFQSFNLIPVLTAAENVEYILRLQKIPSSIRRQKVKAILADVGLADKADQRPSELSGGQQQRIAVARAVVASPAIVLADEPTANLDSVTGQKLLDLMQQMNTDKQVTFVFATHDKMVMDYARRVITLKDGRIADDIRK
ncbi:ABC transporter ATP-binding protein [Desulfogranum marinum]|uniref:ABC transporter ATP-binding protein n=1 Tax=Desulfogranum marinum TaxID=453220 RepID=UPI001963F97A|nr:ABC transporter ATP-binding protein [Desulfogranum marinum]MBM9512080.1 ABC transporter ATP-binding protein [Desulfogranum marinum]